MHQQWQVETVELDLGTGLREWIEVRHSDARWHVATLGERDRLLRERGVDPADLREQDIVDDGCE
jgi:hypothetical protein